MLLGDDEDADRVGRRCPTTRSSPGCPPISSRRRRIWACSLRPLAELDQRVVAVVVVAVATAERAAASWRRARPGSRRTACCRRGTRRRTTGTTRSDRVSAIGPESTEGPPATHDERPMTPERFYVETLGCPKNAVDSDKVVASLLADGLAPAAAARRRRPRRRQHVRVHRGGAPGVDRRRARARRRRKRPAPSSWSPAAWPSATATSSRPRCPRSTRSSGFAGEGALADVVLARPQADRRARPARAAAARRRRAPWAYVKVAEGCDRACAFCAIPSFRGKQRSRTPESIEAEVRGARRARRRRDRARRAGPRVVRARRRRARRARAAAAPARRARGRRPRARPAALPLPDARCATRSSRRCSSCRPSCRTSTSRCSTRRRGCCAA